MFHKFSQVEKSMNQLRWRIIGCDGKLDRSNQIFLEEDKKQKQFNANRHHHHQKIIAQLT